MYPDCRAVSLAIITPYSNILGSEKNVHFLMLNIPKISRRFFCKFGMVSPKYTIHRSNIKPIRAGPNFSLYMTIHNIA